MKLIIYFLKKNLESNLEAKLEGLQLHEEFSLHQVDLRLS